MKKYLLTLTLTLWAGSLFASNPEQYQDQDQRQYQSSESSSRAHGGDADVDNTVRTHVNTSSEGGDSKSLSYSSSGDSKSSAVAGDSNSSSVTGDSTSSVGDVANSGNTEVTVKDEGDSVTVEGSTTTTNIDYDIPVSTSYSPQAIANSYCGRTAGLGIQGRSLAGSLGLPLPSDPQCERKVTAGLYSNLGNPVAGMYIACHDRHAYLGMTQFDDRMGFLSVDRKRGFFGFTKNKAELIQACKYNVSTMLGLNPTPVVAAPVLQEVVRLDLNVEFEYDSDVVTGNYYQELQEVADFMNTYQGADLVVEGHTDNRASHAYNRDLSARRALSVRNVLVSEFGIDRNRITAVGYGEERLIDFTETEEGHQRNRRVVGELSEQVVK